VHVHETRLLPPHHVTLIEEFLVTRPARTVFDVAANSPFPQVEALLDRFWSDRLVTCSDMVETLDDLDRRASDLLEACGIVALERQVDVGGRQFAGRVDLLHRPSRTVIETQSDRWHVSLVDRSADDRRANKIERLGPVVVPVWESELFSARISGSTGWQK
jgi:hypothetical protein